MTNLPVGNFKAEITLSGGTGRTTIQSPADIHIENGVITAEIVWSSSSYDLMIVDGKEYKPDSMEGGSRFIVEIPSLDTPLDIQAETLAMTTPHMIDYTITVSSKEILTGESTSSFGESAADSEGSTTSADNQSVDLSSLLESITAKLESASGTGSSFTVFSAVVSGREQSSDIPPIAILVTGAVIGAVVAFVAITIGKRKK